MKKPFYLTFYAIMFALANLHAQETPRPNPDLLARIEASGNFAPMFPFQPTHNAPENITNVGTWTAVGRSVEPKGFISPAGESDRTSL